MNTYPTMRATNRIMAIIMANAKEPSKIEGIAVGVGVGAGETLIKVPV
jgi:hypothetical protein